MSKIYLENKLQNLQDLSDFLRVYQRDRSELFKPAPSNLDEKINLDSRINVMAFYLPQYHQFELNDGAWGRGFTDWENVTRTYPFFPGHHQPHQPIDMGYYDLKNCHVIERQIQLAKYSGIRGFCFHYYSFLGQKIMNEPIDMFLKRPVDRFNYMINWANENWSKKWNGGNKDLIIEQIHTPDSDMNFFLEILPYLRDERYLKINDKLPIMIYRPALMFPHLPETLSRWREMAKKEGVGELLLLRSNFHEFEFQQLCNDYTFGQDPFDGVVQFPPHGNFDINHITIPQNLLFNKNYEGRVFDYVRAANRFLNESAQDSRVFPGVIPSWDNSARMLEESIVYVNSSPKLYENWLEEAIKISVKANKNLVFINAWNEWAEGAHIEPSSWYGYAHIEATRYATSNSLNEIQ